MQLTRPVGYSPVLGPDLRFAGKKRPVEPEVQLPLAEEIEEHDDSPDFIGRRMKEVHELYKCIQIGSAMAFGLFTAIGMSRLPEEKKLTDVVINQNAVSNPWPKNTKIYASSSQERVTVGETYSGRVFVPFLYKNPTFQSLDESINNTKDGWAFFFEPQIPVASSNPATGWHRKDNGKVNRYVLLVSSPPATDKPFREEIDNYRLAANIKMIRAAIKQGFEVPDDHIKELTKAEEGDFESTVKNWLAKLPDQANSEVLILYNGHGYSWPDYRNEERGIKGQGSYEGSISIGEETALKGVFQRYLKGFKNVTFIIHSCHSGAFVA